MGRGALAPRPMEVLIFGASFDPPHLGHLALLRAGIEALRPGAAYVVPAWRSPLKARHGASPRDRLAMARLALRCLPAEAARTARVDPSEIRAGRVTYTFETVRRVRRRHPGASLWLLAGSDALAGLARWRRPAELSRACGWVVGARPRSPGRGGGAARQGSFEPRPGPWPSRLLRLRETFPDVSSTSLRARFLAALDPWRELPGPVAAHVRRRALYGLAARRELSETLAPKRWRHTLEVSRWALELAERHGLDPEAAALAGLLHDAGRRYGPAALARLAPRLRDAPWRGVTARRSPMLLHAYAGADLARRRFGVRDRAVLAAISDHTLGRRGMGPLERLLYVADASSKDRVYRGVSRLRALARRDLDAAFARAAALKIRWVRASGAWLHPRTGDFSSWVESSFA